jgi:hypothetical protein
MDNDNNSNNNNDKFSFNKSELYNTLRVMQEAKPTEMMWSVLMIVSDKPMVRKKKKKKEKKRKLEKKECKL